MLSYVMCEHDMCKLMLTNSFLSTSYIQPPQALNLALTLPPDLARRQRKNVGAWDSKNY